MIILIIISAFLIINGSVFSMEAPAQQRSGVIFSIDEKNPKKIKSLEKLCFRAIVSRLESEVEKFVYDGKLCMEIPHYLKERLVRRLVDKSPYIKMLLLQDSIHNDGKDGMAPAKRSYDGAYIRPLVHEIYIDKSNTISKQTNELIVHTASTDYGGHPCAYIMQAPSHRIFTIHGDSHTIAVWNTKNAALVHRWATSLKPCNVQVRTNMVASMLIQYHEYDTLKPVFDEYIGVGTLGDNGIFKRILPFGKGECPSKFIFDTSGEYLIVGSNRGGVALCDIDSLKFLSRAPQTHVKKVTALATAKKLLIASGSADASIFIWDPLKRKDFVLEGHTASLYSINFNQSGDLLVSCAKDNTTRFWNVPLRQCLYSLDTNVHIIPGIFTESDDSLLCGASIEENDTVLKFFAINAISFDGQHHGMTEVKHTIVNKEIRTQLYEVSLEHILGLYHMGKKILKNGRIDFSGKKTLWRLYGHYPDRIKKIIKKYSTWADWLGLNYEDTKALVLPA